jgi:hypothetical protein
MPRRLRHAKLRELDLDVELALWLGLRLEVFASVRERREAWERHREELLARLHWQAQGNPGSRPFAWWEFDAGPGAPAPGDFPDREDGLPEPGELAGDDRFELARVVFLAEQGHMDVEETRAYVGSWVRYLKAPRA